MFSKSNLLFDQEMRCRAALRMIDVPESVIWSLEGPILFQVAHLCCVIDQPMHWRDALRWCNDHKGEILNHMMQIENEKRKDALGKDSSAATGADRETD